MQRMQTFAAAATIGLVLAGCGAGSGSGMGAGTAMPAATNAMSPSAMSSSARIASGGSADAFPIEALNTIGAPVKVLAEENGTDGAPPTTTWGSGACKRRIETFVPDQGGDPNSSEIKFFYDAACTHIARDTLRTYASTGTNSESVNLTVKNYLLSGTQTSVRTTTALLGNATFTANGFPIAADGFTREASSQLTVGNSRRVVVAGSEIIVDAAASGSTSGAFCSDAAAYNSVGFPRLGVTFGWDGVLANGTRTANADGSVTWEGTHTGTEVKGAPGTLSLVTGTPNTACPISTPAYTVAGGTAAGTADSTIAVTFLRGAVENLTISAASLSGGYTMNVSTNSQLWPSNPQYITGVIALNGATVASFAVDAFGDGTLNLAKRGLTFAVVDWIAIR
jgi:hypothetical protein